MIEERFWSKVNKNGPVPACRPDLGPCWIWTGSVEGKGDENVRRGQGPVVAGGRSRAKTHCPRGHPYDEMNTRRSRDGKRHCRECQRRRDRTRRKTTTTGEDQ